MEKRPEATNVLNPEAISKEGALGLLALGSVGLRAWRKVRDAVAAETRASVEVASDENVKDRSMVLKGEGGKE